MKKAMDEYSLHVVVSREDVLSGNTQPTLDTLKVLVRSPEDALMWRENVDISFEGYDESNWELFEIPEVRAFVHQLDQSFPFWLFFLSKAHFGLQCIMLCFLPPFLKVEAKARIFPERIGRLLEDRWVPAMNRACEFVSMSEPEIEQMTNRVIDYLKAG